MQGQVSSTPGCTFVSNTWNKIYRRTSAFVGYVVWVAVLALLWICLFSIAIGPIICCRIHHWPPLQAWFPFQFFPTFSTRDDGIDIARGNGVVPISNVTKLQRARVKEGCLVAIMSALRLAYLAMLVTIAFQTKAPTFACVEFSFNRSNQPSVTTDGLLQSTEATHYTTPGFELLQALFYPFFLLAGRYYLTSASLFYRSYSHPSSISSSLEIIISLNSHPPYPFVPFYFSFAPVFGRQEWLDAEARYMGILLHTRRSRRDMVYCSLLRKIFSILALGFIFALFVVIIVMTATKLPIDKSPLRSMARGSQVIPLGQAIDIIAVK